MMRLSIFGFGSFGQLITKYLVPQAEVFVYDRKNDKARLIESLGAKAVNLAGACDAKVIILAVNLENLESTLKSIAPHLQPGTLVVDVTSVKLKPVELMKQYVPADCQILATHPLFGPNSAAESLAGQRIVIDPVRVDDESEIKEILKSLGLEIIHMSADEHDREMAWVHGLTFFVGRGLLNLEPPKSALGTHYYKELLDVVNVEKTHSLDLFYTIQRGNPYVPEIREQLIASLRQLEQDIVNE